MQTYILRRVLLFIPTIVLLTLLIFLFLRVIPGDPALQVLTSGTGEGSFTEEQLEAVRKDLGLDRPLHMQYGIWIWNLLQGDLGTSYFFGVEISEQMKVRVPVTLELTFLGLAIAFVVAVPLGILSALKQDTLFDYIARIISFAGVAIPNFVTALVTVYLLVRIFNWIPPLDYAAPWDDLGKNLSQMIFPSLVMAFLMMAFISRITRSSFLEVLREDYIRTARAKGLRERQVVYIHALRNSFLPILTVTGWYFGVYLGGTVVIESIFVLPGMGKLLLDSIFHRDYAVVQAEVFLIALMVLVLNLFVDLLYGWVDPRIRFGS